MYMTCIVKKKKKPKQTEAHIRKVEPYTEPKWSASENNGFSHCLVCLYAACFSAKY